MTVIRCPDRDRWDIAATIRLPFDARHCAAITAITVTEERDDPTV